MYPKIHPKVLCITSSTSEKPRMRKNWSDSMVTEIPHPIIATINNVIDFVASLVEEPFTINHESFGDHEPLTLNSEPSIIPMGMNTMTFMIFSAN